jgi:5'-deoxynucleotidase YfbR-like HD superfamily hydrolase
MLQETIDKGVDLETARWQARVDLAAAHRLCVMHDFHEGIFNHLTFRVPARTTATTRSRSASTGPR